MNHALGQAEVEYTAEPADIEFISGAFQSLREEEGLSSGPSASELQRDLKRLQAGLDRVLTQLFPTNGPKPLEFYYGDSGGELEFAEMLSSLVPEFPMEFGSLVGEATPDGEVSTFRVVLQSISAIRALREVARRGMREITKASSNAKMVFAFELFGWFEARTGGRAVLSTERSSGDKSSEAAVFVRALILDVLKTLYPQVDAPARAMLPSDFDALALDLRDLARRPRLESFIDRFNRDSALKPWIDDLRRSIANRFATAE